MSSYASVSAHRQMHLDKVRNSAYARALEKLVGNQTTVMDLGAGLGVHGLNAAKMGAAKVYLVEPEPVVELAGRIAKDNHLDNVECLQQRVEDIELDARVDVIVSVFTGNFLLSEDLLPSLFLARDKFLAPGGSLVPDRACMEVVPVCVPDYYRKHIEVWQDYSDFCREHELPELDYKTARSFAANSLYYDSVETFKATQLAEPVDLKEIDFYTATDANCDEQVEVSITMEGECHGWLGWFRMRLGQEWLSTGPAAPDTHWNPVFMPLETPLQLSVGEPLGFQLKRPEFGEWTWTTEHGGKNQRQSTFLSQPLSSKDVLKASDIYQPRLSERGRAAQWLLSRMEGDIQVSALSSELQRQFPELFATAADGLKFAKQLAQHFS